MNKIFALFLVTLLFVSCKDKKDTTTKTTATTTTTTTTTTTKIPVHAWTDGPGEATDEELLTTFTKYKEHGIDRLMYHGGHDPETYKRVGRIAKEADLEFHTWIPTMKQDGTNPKIKPEWYTVNRLGESTYDKPVFIPSYQILCPSKDEVYQFLSNLYTEVANVSEVDGIHLDYIRFSDVILAKGLWEKYGLVMDKEYPKYDYCYCDDCVKGFKEKTGIDIKAADDPSQVQEWKQYRYNLITSVVNRLVVDVHKTGKKITSAVFPGPTIAKNLVRQEWNKWNLDAIYPMNYNDFYLEDAKWVGQMVKEEVAAVEGKKPIYSGLFITPFPGKKADHPDPEDHGLAPDELVEAIEESMINGAAGICLFTPERMTDAHWEIFKDAIYKEYNKVQ